MNRVPNLFRTFLSVLAALTATLSAQAAAGDITVVVTDAAGKPVPDAVVTFDVPGRRPSPGRFTVSQHDMMFMPEVLVVPVGSTVTFGNLDPFRHHVYSFSETRKFELKLFGHGQQRPVIFDKPGLVAIGCNIHDQMQAFIHVVDTAFAGRTDARGRVVLADLPAGRHALRLWHARLRSPGHQLSLQVDTSADRTVPIQAKLRAPAPQMTHY
jgi:plastocyanin